MRKKELLIKLICIISITCFCFISNVSNANDVRWNVYFDNIEVTQGSVSAEQEATIIGSSRSEITYDVTLGLPGDFYEFTVDIVNDGTVDAMIDQVGINRLTEAQKKYMTYVVTYSDGMEVKENDLLRAGTTEKIRVRLAFKDEVAPLDMPGESTALTLVLNTSYVQADENAVDREKNTIDNSNAINNTISPNSVNNTNVANTINETNNTINNTITNNDNQTSVNNNPIARVKNAKTGDDILKYVIILILSAIALVILYKKNEDK